MAAQYRILSYVFLLALSIISILILLTKFASYSSERNCWGDAGIIASCTYGWWMLLFIIVGWIAGLICPFFVYRKLKIPRASTTAAFGSFLALFGIIFSLFISGSGFLIVFYTLSFVLSYLLFSFRYVK